MRVVIGVLAFIAGAAALPVAAQDVIFTIPEAELLWDSEFGAKAWGPGTLASRTDGPGSSVDFAFTGLGVSGTGVKDNYPVDAVYGQVIPSHGNGDFSIFTGYGLLVENLDEGSTWFQVCINTGFTGPSGTPPNDLTNDTYWTSSPGWIYIQPGEERLIVLDFDRAMAYNITDNKVPHTGGGLSWSDGDDYAINAFDRAEVSAIGFEIADFIGSNPAVTVRLTPVASDAGVAAFLCETSALRAYPSPGRVVTIRIGGVGGAAGRRPEVGPATLAVYDVRGRLVRSLWAGELGGVGGGESEDLEIVWDGTNAGGARCAPGVYLVCLEGANGARAVRVLLAD